MVTINLRDFYPFYAQDTMIEVSNEVAVALAEAERVERNYMRRIFYNKAQYSIDAEDGVESTSIECRILSPDAILDLMERHCRLCHALNSLPEIQGRRIESHYLLGISKKDIAYSEGVSENSVTESIYRGLRAMRRYFNKTKTYCKK